MVYTAEDIRQLNEKIQYQSAFIDRLRDEIGRVIVGQHYMLDRLLIGLLSNGHVLLEGVPGLALGCRGTQGLFREHGRPA